MDEHMEDDFYLRRLDAGLFTLQLVDYIMMEVSATGSQSVSVIFWYHLGYKY